MFKGLNRREFIETTAGAALALGLADSLASAADALPAEVAPLVDPLLKADPFVVPEAENALPLLLAAAQAATEAPPDTIEDHAAASSAEPDPERQQRITGWLNENKRALELFAEALGRRQASFPNAGWGNEQAETGGRFRTLFYMLRENAHALASRGNASEAVAASRSMLRGARLLRGAGGFFVYYLTAAGCEGIAAKSMCQLARDPRTPPATLYPLLSDLSDDKDPWRGDLRRATQTEFNLYALPELLKLKSMAPGGVLTQLVGEWDEDLAPVLSRDDFEARLKQVVELFDGHPRAFDFADTIRRTSRLFARMVRGIDLSWADFLARPDDEDTKELGAWPASLDLASLRAPRSTKMDDAELAAARRRLRAVDNPIGKRFVALLGDAPDLRRPVQIHQACRNGARLMLAATIYLRETGGLPPDLDALVAAKIVDRVPLDAFSELPFGYSSARRRIWRPSATNDERRGSEFADWAYWILPQRAANKE